MQNIFQDLLKLDFTLSDQMRLKASDTGLFHTAKLIAHSGDSWVWAIGLGLVWLFSSGPLHRYVAVLEISVVVQALFVFGLKALIRRKRPNGEDRSIYRQYDPHSFPSGHATRAVLLAVMAMLLGPTWFGWVMLLWAPLVCVSRVMTGLHYWSDILGGVLLGALMGGLMVQLSPLLIAWFPFLF